MKGFDQGHKKGLKMSTRMSQAIMQNIREYGLMAIQNVNGNVLYLRSGGTLAGSEGDTYI